MQPHRKADNDIDDGQHGSFDYTSKHQKRNGIDEEAIGCQCNQKPSLFTSAGINHTILFSNMERDYSPKSNQSDNGMRHLMGKSLDEIDIFFQIPVHDGKHNGPQRKPKKPRVIAAFVVAEPFRQVADMMRQGRPDFSYEEDAENDENDTKQYVCSLFQYVPPASCE